MTSQPEPSPEVADRRLLRHVFGAFATGVTVVTVGGPAPHGMTANSFTTVSLTPPLVSVCVERAAVMHSALATARHFAVSVLAAGQESIARHFADRRRPLGAAQFDVVDWMPGPRTSAPLIAGALAHLECVLWRSYDGGDHSIVVGNLVSAGRADGSDDGLLFVGGRFGQLRHDRSEVTT